MEATTPRDRVHRTPLAEFLRQRCLVGEGVVPASLLAKAYKDWAIDRGGDRLSPYWFRVEVAGLPWVKVSRSGAQQLYHGITLVESGS